ncbi:hypothetical protein OH76DRAFT_1479427 [Lentinus brumalis]|uniref:Uncharacterized protein n=1 Tax=Lentinus brumalis TaxID=2498619 RepID=A0A371DM93_9APHY|nr:hypothetical protein OH76DRAFT_1479427 [Polyporus brumalis]
MFKAVALFVRRRYELYVRPYVTDILAFDKLLRAHGAIISGPIALHYFVPDSFATPRHLDIYLPGPTFHSFVRIVGGRTGLNWKYIPRRVAKRYPSQPYDDMNDYVSHERPRYHRPTRASTPSPHLDQAADDSDSHLRHGFANESSDDNDSDSNSSDIDRSELFCELEQYNPHRPSIVYGKGFRGMRTYRTTTGRRVNVISSRSRNPITPLRFFWSSLMMNFIAPDSCFCGFPTATLVHMGTLKVESPGGWERAVRARYESRGFTFDGSLRSALDMWDYMFFGEQNLLALDFRDNFDASRAVMPLQRTVRGWLPDPDWKSRV